MPFDFLPLLLLFLFHSHIDQAHPMECRGIPIDQMKTFKYQSDQWKKPMEVKISEKEMHVFANKIHIGFTGANANLPKNKCVAIKIYNKNLSKDYENSAQIGNKIKEIDPKNEHIVSLIDYGKFDESNTLTNGGGFLTVLELGERDLDGEVKYLRFLSPEGIKTMIKEIVKPLVAFHEVGIHLDFKPANLIVFEGMEEELPKTEEKKKSSKLSFFKKNNKIKEEKKKEEEQKEREKEEKEREKRMKWEGKVIKLIDFDGSVQYLKGQQKGKVPHKSLIHTGYYAAPELQHLYKNSSKTDILEVTPKMDIWSAGITILDHFKSKCKQMPEIALLVRNMLNIEPEKRMTAKGIIDYLEGKCKPKEYEKNAEEIAQFVEESHEGLRKVMKEELHHFVSIDVTSKNVKDFLEELVKREKICDH